MKQKTTKMFSRAAMTLLLSVLTTMTAWANDAVTYIDMDGKTKTITEYTEVTNSTGDVTWDTGTYVVKNTFVVIDGCIYIDGKEINLIVCDGANLVARKAFDGRSDDSSSSTLNIYAQSDGEDMGVIHAYTCTACHQLNIAGGKVWLHASTDKSGLYLYSKYTSGLTVNGGDVTIENNSDSQGAIAFHGHGSVTLNGGKLTVTNSDETDKMAILGRGLDSNTINFNGGTAEINGKIRDFKNINLNGGNVTVNGEVYSFTYGYTVTYDFTDTTDSYYIKAFSNALNSGKTRTVQVKDGSAFLCNGNKYIGPLTLNNDQIAAISGQTMTPDISNHFSVNDAGTEYTIHTAKGWDLFCDALEDNDTYNHFIDKTVKLGADIGTADAPVTRMAGSQDHRFRGTFDGDNHTLTVSYTTDTQGAAPFLFVDRGHYQYCSINNLHVAGTITTSNMFAGGIVAHAYSTLPIINCRSSVTINSSVNGDGTHGGLVAIAEQDSYIRIEGCLFDGKLLTTNGTNRCAGFVGFHYYPHGIIDIKNSLYAPADLAEGETWADTTESATITRNGINAPDNCYYTQTFGEAQGKALHTITAGADVSIEPITLTGEETVYTTSGITAYSGGGLKYGDKLYYGSGDKLSLTLNNTATGDVPAGYKHGGYSTDAGTLVGSTITMPDADVIVSAALLSIGQPVSVRYIKADGTSDTYDAIALDGTESTLGENGQKTWYFVGNDFKHSGNIYCYGHVNIILADGKTMTTTTSGQNGIYIFDDYNSLTIYGQALGTGTLNAAGKDSGICSDNSNITIIGGTVNATGTDGYDYGIDSKSGNITISGGTVNATGDIKGINTEFGNITISGGKVTATGGPNDSGIYSGSGAITLGCTTTSDFIKANRYGVQFGSVKIAEGQKLYDEDGTEYSGTLTYPYPVGKTLCSFPTVLVYDTKDNSEAINGSNGQQRNVILYGRTLYKDGEWNTLCLPFDVSTISGPLSGDNVQAMVLNNSEGSGTGFDASTGVLTLNFSEISTSGEQQGVIPAGTPFIIRWGTPESNPGTTLTDPVFQSVTIDNSDDAIARKTQTSADGTVSFKGTYAKQEYTEENKSILLLGAENTLYWPKPDGDTKPTIGAFRAYFELGGGQQARQFVLNFGDDSEGTGIIFVSKESGSKGVNAAWYTLDGRKLDAQPTKKGMYIHEGRKVAIK